MEGPRFFALGCVAFLVWTGCRVSPTRQDAKVATRNTDQLYFPTLEPQILIFSEGYWPKFTAQYRLERAHEGSYSFSQGFEGQGNKVLFRSYLCQFIIDTITCKKHNGLTKAPNEIFTFHQDASGSFHISREDLPASGAGIMPQVVASNLRISEYLDSPQHYVFRSDKTVVEKSVMLEEWRVKPHYDGRYLIQRSVLKKSSDGTATKTTYELHNRADCQVELGGHGETLKKIGCDAGDSRAFSALHTGAQFYDVSWKGVTQKLRLIKTAME